MSERAKRLWQLATGLETLAFLKIQEAIYVRRLEDCVDDAKEDDLLDRLDYYNDAITGTQETLQRLRSDNSK